MVVANSGTLKIPASAVPSEGLKDLRAVIQGRLWSPGAPGGACLTSHSSPGPPGRQPTGISWVCSGSLIRFRWAHSQPPCPRCIFSRHIHKMWGHLDLFSISFLALATRVIIYSLVDFLIRCWIPVPLACSLPGRSVPCPQRHPIGWALLASPFWGCCLQTLGQ